MVSSCIHIAGKAMISFFFMVAKYFMVYLYHIFFIQSPIGGNLGLFHIFAIVSSTVMNIWMHMCLWQNDLFSFDYVPRNGIAELNGSSAFPSLRNLQNAFHSDCTNLHSHQQCISVSFIPQTCQHLLFFYFLTKPILIGVRWYLNVVLIFISQMTSDDVYLPFHFKY